MLTAIRQQDGAKVVAAHVDKSAAPFVCISCRRTLILNKGQIRVHHFRHPPVVTDRACSHGRGESLAHLQCKMEIFDALRRDAQATDVELEKQLGPAIADVFARIRGHPVAIEVQRTILSVSEVRTRTQVYTSLGINVLWIARFDNQPDDTHHNPNACERWLHAACLGRVYHWAGGLSFRPVHYDALHLPVDERRRFEAGGVIRLHPAYTRASRRFRTPSAGPLADLVRDFRPRVLPPYIRGTVDVPRRRVFMDRNPPWWPR